MDEYDEYDEYLKRFKINQHAACLSTVLSSMTTSKNICDHPHITHKLYGKIYSFTKTTSSLAFPHNPGSS